MINNEAEVSSLQAEGASARFFDATGEPIEALRSVTKRFVPGSMVTIMGPSGSGKTTLIHALVVKI
jgi:ABC-type lipoprotein export system ATPase subunit